MNDMNSFVTEFEKRAQAAGLTADQANNFMRTNLFNNKSAEEFLAETYAGVIKSAGFNDEPMLYALTDSIVKAACAFNIPFDAACGLAKQSLDNYSVATGVYQQRAAEYAKVAEYVEGFTKAAQEAGLTNEQIDLLTKEAIDMNSILAALKTPEMLGGLIGAGAGGALGYGMSDDKNKTRNAILSALAGGGLGAGAGYMFGGSPAVNNDPSKSNFMGPRAAFGPGLDSAGNPTGEAITDQEIALQRMQANRQQELASLYGGAGAPSEAVSSSMRSPLEEQLMALGTGKNETEEAMIRRRLEELMSAASGQKGSQG